MFGPARDAVGAASVVVAGATVREVLDELRGRYGTGLAELLEVSKVWVDGDPVGPDVALGADDELAVLPPVSGG